MKSNSLVPLERVSLSPYVGMKKKNRALFAALSARREELRGRLIRLAGKCCPCMPSANALAPTSADTKWQGEFEHIFPYANNRPLTSHRRDQARHEQPRFDGSLIAATSVRTESRSRLLQASWKATMAILRRHRLSHNISKPPAADADYLPHRNAHRFRSPAEQRKVFRSAEGRVDIVLAPTAHFPRVIFKDSSGRDRRGQRFGVPQRKVQ